MKEIGQMTEKKSLASSTYQSRVTALTTILNELGTFDPEALHQWLNEKINPRTKTKLSGHGKNRYIIALKWYLKHTQLIYGAKELYQQLKKYAAPKSPGKVISTEQLEYVLQYAPDDLHDLAFRILFETAMRPHELLSVRFSDITFFKEHRYATLTLQDDNPTTPLGKNKTGGRVVCIQDSYQELLALYTMKKEVQGFKKDERVFPWGHAYLTRKFIEMKQRAKKIEVDASAQVRRDDELLNFRLYDLRHTAITRYYTRGIPNQVIRKAVGWAPASKMPNTYVHIQSTNVIEKFLMYSDTNPPPGSNGSQKMRGERVCKPDLLDKKPIGSFNLPNLPP